MKKILSILLSILMAFSAFSVMPFSAYSKDYGKTEFNPNVLVRGDTFEMGMYPQSKVTSSSLISTLNGIECAMTNYGYIKKSNAENHTFESTDITYADIEYNNARYRKVLFKEERPTYTYKESGGYQESNGYPINTVYYFKWEPIVWQVLANEDDGVYVTSKMLLDSQPYNNYQEATSWETCSLRAWMINDFYNSAFSSVEKAKMVSVTNKNDAYWEDTQIYGNDTTDNIWLLSYSDAHNTDYGFISVTSGDYANDNARKMPVTDYAKCQGASTNYNLSLAEWSLRTVTTGTNFVWNCDSTGRYDSCSVSKVSMGIRPAFKLSKEYKHTVSFNAGTGTGSMDPVSVEDGTEFKFPNNTGFSKENRTFIGWKVDNEYLLSLNDTVTITKDTVFTAVYSELKREDRSVDKSTSEVLGTLKLTDTRTGEVYTKDVYDETTASKFDLPSNPSVNVMIDEAKEALQTEAKAKAGENIFKIIKDETSDPEIVGTDTSLTSSFVMPFSEELGERPSKDEESGDLYVYLFTDGSKYHRWKYTVTLEAEYTSKAPTPVISPEDAALPTEEATEELIKKTNTDKTDVVGSTYAPLKLKASAKKKNITVSWKAVNKADGYIIYGAPCGRKMTKLVTITNPGAVKYTFKNLIKGKYYKCIVVAYKKTAAGNRVIAKSKSVHCATAGGKKGNPRGIKLKKSKIKIKANKKAKIKATLLKKGKVATHISKFRYESANPEVATVDAKGNIKAKKKGKAVIYVYTQNGICKTVKVTVK